MPLLILLFYLWDRRTPVRHLYLYLWDRRTPVRHLFLYLFSSFSTQSFALLHSQSSSFVTNPAFTGFMTI